MSKVALAMIVAGRDEEAAHLETCLSSVAKYVDGIFIQLNARKGQKISPKIRKVAEKYTRNIEKYVWKDNFADARNANFAQVPKEYDFILWLDSDDTVENPEKLKETANVVPKSVAGIYACYDYAHDEYGNVTMPHYVARLVRNNGSYAWKSSFDDTKYSVHETLVEQRSVGKRISEEFKVVHHADATRSMDSLYRNLYILRQMYEHQLKQQRLDPRILFYLGTHLFDARDYRESQKLLQEYMTLSGWANERSEALVYLGQIMAMDGKDGQSKHAYTLAISEAPNNPRPYTEIADLELKNKRYNGAAEWAMKAIECKKRQTAMALRPMDATFRPYMIYAQALTKLGGTRLEEAMKYVDKALKLRPYDPETLDQRDLIEELTETRDLNRAFARLVRAVDGDKVKTRALLEGIPNKLLDSPVVAQVRHETMEAKVWPKKSMVIWCGNSVLETWGPSSLVQGIGGSEEAVVRLKTELEKQGWEVHVYATPGPDVDETWHNYWEFNPKDEFDVVVAWRAPWFFDMEFNARKKYLWLHDVMPASEFTPERLDNLDKVIVLSKYHRSLFPKIPDNKIFLSANGITPEDFDEGRIPYYNPGDGHREYPIRDPHRIIWMSSHVRGLQLLYDIWPDIKKAVPKATLDIFYGWESFVNVQRDNPERMAWKSEMERLEKTLDGVTDHGKIGQSQIVEEIFQSGIWAYPCVTGDTLVDMPRNYQQYPLGVPIRKLVGKKNFPVWSYNETTGAFELKNVNWVAKTREKAKIIKINWADGTSLRCTPDHKIYTYKRGWVEAKDLEVNDSAVALKKHMMVQVSMGQGKWPYEHRAIAEYMLGEIPKGYHVDHEDGNCFNNEPSNLQILSPSDHAKKTYKEQYSTQPLIERRKTSLANWRATDKGKEQLKDIGSKRSKKFWDNLSAEDRKIFIEERAKKVARANKERIEAMSPEERSLIGAEGRQSRWNHKVESIEDAGYEDVYDMNVTDNHNFIAGGVVVHNCPFPEIFCITALKSQAGGAIPVASNFAALDETIQYGVKVPMTQVAEELPSGRWNQKEVKTYKDALIDMLKHPEKQEQLRPQMMKWARTQSWEKVAEGWDEEFNS